MKRTSTSGLTLIEMIIGVALGAVALLVAAQMLMQTSRFGEQSMARAGDDTVLLRAAQMILNIGRAAGGPGCTQTGVATLECRVDRRVPPVGALDRVRFTLVGNTLRYEEFRAGAWQVLTTFPNIVGFDLCGGAAIFGGACPIVPGALNQILAIAGDPAYSVFRFRLTRGQVGAVAESANQIQSAFFSRNTMPLAPGVMMQMGGTQR